MIIQDTYVAERAEAMQNVESTIAELGTIFQQLAEMIQQQGEKVERIDQNVEEVVCDLLKALLTSFRVSI